MCALNCSFLCVVGREPLSWTALFLRSPECTHYARAFPRSGERLRRTAPRLSRKRLIFRSLREAQDRSIDGISRSERKSSATNSAHLRQKISYVGRKLLATPLWGRLSIRPGKRKHYTENPALSSVWTWKAGRVHSHRRCWSRGVATSRPSVSPAARDCADVGPAGIRRCQKSRRSRLRTKTTKSLSGLSWRTESGKLNKKSDERRRV